jgi:putative spermidine/putrescine transport system substrate-binding protein
VSRVAWLGCDRDDLAAATEFGDCDGHANDIGVTDDQAPRETMMTRHRFGFGATGVATVALLGLSAGPAFAADLTVTSFGGAYQDAQREVYFEPFKQESGLDLVEDVWNGGVGALRAKVEGGGQEWDVVQVEAEELVIGCEEGLYEIIDWDTVGGKDQFIDAAVHDCGVGTIVWSTVLAYDGDKITDDPPQSWADFWDVEKYPGKRGLRRHPKYTLESALLADGVPPDQVYETLRTEEGVDRAFAKLDEIKDHVIWWEAGAQAPQLLASGEVVMTNAWNGRISAANEEGRNFKIVWPGSIYAVDSWVILRGTPHKAAAVQFIAFASQPERQKDLPNAIAYGVTHKGAAEQIDKEVLVDLPTGPDNLAAAIELDTEFWVENVERLTERFTAWAQ